MKSLPALNYTHSEQLSRIVGYASTTHQPSSKVIFLHTGLFVVALISPITYIKPSYDDTPPYHLPDHPFVKGLQVVSTWSATTALLYLACMDFIQTRMQNTVPIELDGIVEGLSRKEMRRQDWGIGTISAASAIPLTTPLVKFPLIESGNQNIDIPANAILVSVILMSNGIAHLRPLQVILHDPWYGAPYTLIKSIVRKVQDRRLDTEEKLSKLKKEQENFVNSQLKTFLAQTLNTKKSQLIGECFIFRRLPFPGCQIQLTETFQQLDGLSDDSLIAGLIEYKNETITQTAFQSPAWRQKAYHLFLTATSQVAGLLALGESLGYLADSGFELSKLTHSNGAGWFLAAVPIWAFGVLIHNAARASTYENVDFLINFVRGKRTLSWPIKYCSGIYFGLLGLPSAAILLLNASAANTMIRTDFEDYCDDTFIDNYIATFRWGFVWLATLLIIDMDKYLFSKWAKYKGTPEAKQIALFDERVNTVILYLNQLKPEIFHYWLSQQTPAFRASALGICEEKYQELIEKKDARISTLPSSQQPSQTIGGWFSSFFQRRNSSSFEYQKLKESGDAKSLQSEPRSSRWSAVLCWKKRQPRIKTPTSPPKQEMEKR